MTGIVNKDIEYMIPKDMIQTTEHCHVYKFTINTNVAPLCLFLFHFDVFVARLTLRLRCFVISVGKK